MMRIPKVAVMIETSREYGRGLLRGISRYAHLHGPWSFRTEPPFYLPGATHNEDSYPAVGEVFDGWITREQPNMEQFLQLGIPMVVASYVQETLPVPRVVTDCEAIGQMAAAHLINLGLQNFAYCGYDHMYWSRRRGTSFAEHVNKAGFVCHRYEQSEDMGEVGWELEQSVLMEWLSDLPKPIGLMACNDDRGRQAMEACQWADIKVPEEVAVIGVDGDEFICNLADKPLSSINLNLETAGYETADLLDRLMSGEPWSGESIVVKPTGVSHRLSTDILALQDQDVAQGLRFIRHNARKHVIDVMDVVKATTLSRRVLERRFREALNRSINDEIRQVRVEHLCQLLLETDLSVLEIAAHLNYSSVEHIARYFRREKGMSPLKYRRMYRGTLYAGSPHKDMPPQGERVQREPE